MQVVWYLSGTYNVEEAKGKFFNEEYKRIMNHAAQSALKGLVLFYCFSETLLLYIISFTLHSLTDSVVAYASK